MKTRNLAPVILLALLLCGSVFAQNNPNVDQGMKPYDSWHGGDLDSVSLTSGGLVLHIPLASFPQRGNLDLSFMVRFSSKQWYIKPQKLDSQGHVIRPAMWQPMANSGTQIVSSVDWWLQNGVNIDSPNDWAPGGVDWSRGVTSPDGNTHQLGGDSSGANAAAYPLYSHDGTGIQHPDLHTIILANGTRYGYPSTFSGNQNTGPSPSTYQFGVQPVSVTDANGNQITIGPNGWTDTLGRVIPGNQPSNRPVQPGVSTTDLSTCPSGTTSASVWNVPGVAGVNGGIRTFKFCYSPVTLQTNFGGANEYGPVSTPLLTAVVLPDLTSIWTFSYDSYGDITRLGFPTGGSISYTYTSGPVTCTATQHSRWVASRTVDANDGTGGHQWSYSYSGQFTASPPAYSGQATVTSPSPDRNDTVHTITSPVAGAYCSSFDSQVQYYQGSTGSGTLLKTISTQYSGNQDWFTIDGDGTTAANVFPAQVTTTLPGGQTAKVINTWDSGVTLSNGSVFLFGDLMQRDEYDFSNSLVRSTVNHYLWQDNSTYKNNNFLKLLATSTLKDAAGNQVGQNAFAYDQYGASGKPGSSGIVSSSLVAPPAGEPFRGNVTTSSRWLDTTNSLVSSTIAYLDTGMKSGVTDPLGNVTSYTYSPTFVGAYVTQTNMPDTQMPDAGAPIVHHVISGNYDLNTGLLTSFTDENGQVFSYQYDSMLRMTQGNHPDGGITKFNYPDPNTIERQRLISGTTYDDYKVKFDGVGRAVQTQQLTPDCTSYIKVDTTYDSAGRAASVSNPYCLTNEATYGISQNQYDALGRITNTIKQDQSASTVQYNAPAGDGAGSTVVCTTAVDEAGKQRQVCSDALGRMVKVIEPNPGAAATNATGWVSVSGSEQTANSQPATSGQGTITISGSEASATVDPCTDNGDPRPCPHTVWDSGVVNITVSTYPAKSYTYGHFDTPATVAWNLSCAFHNDANSPVDAPCPGSAGSSTQVNLTARATGAATNYSFTTSSSTNDPNDFGGPSFSATPASGTFTGGQDASSTPDTGTVTVTVNGTPYSTTYGSGDTASTIAGRLATAINGGSWANASPSGSTINLTSKTPGTAGDFSLSASYTWNSAQFTNPSFTTSTSGSALSGAKDTSALNNNPYVTTYQYNARGDMLCVHQKATDSSLDVACTGTTAPSVPAAWRQRFFTYDSLSRILTAMNPETNSTGSTAISYGYDEDSNVISKTEPAPNQVWGSAATVTINYTYDALNRLLDTTYLDGTTSKTSHRYDYSSFLGQTFTYPIGREVAATASNNTIASFTSYDQMGRVASTVQCNPGVTGCKTFIAAYDKLGDLTSVAYPGNGFTVTYGYDSAARLISATDSSGVVYAQNPTFLGSGAIKEFTSPNFNNNKYHVDYNNRLEPIEIWTGSGPGASALFDKQYQYNAPNTSQMNNGNIYTVTNVKDGTRTQTFGYDVLNRLISAGDQSHWSNTYTYDPWGNLTNKNPGAPAGESLQKSADGNNHLSGLGYGAGGNEIADGLGNTFGYDAENRITSTAGVTYTYDADGRRISKSTGINYWYGPTGAALAETDSGGNWTNYVFFGGQRLARNVGGDIKYYITDHLHSTAMFVDKAGIQAAILDDNDFYPWGGVVSGVGKTTSNNTVKFTGQYRDSESQLDYFGARYYANINGRFMSPDWAAKPTTVPYAEFGDPQSLNLYSYVRNSPITRVDVDGHFLDDCTVCNHGSGESIAPDVDATPLQTNWAAQGYQADGVTSLGAQTKPPQQETKPPAAATSVTVLGQEVAITYSPTLTAAQKTQASDKLTQGAEALNAKADRLTQAQKDAIGQMRKIEVVGEKEKNLGQHPDGSYTISTSYLKTVSAKFAISLLAHEGQHKLNAGKFTGTNLWKDEQVATQTQLAVGKSLGFSQAEIDHLTKWSADSNWKNMQEHMEKGFKF